MTTELENRIIVWCLWSSLVFLFFAKKPEDFAKFTGKMMAWWLSPIILFLMIAVGYFERKKLRWLKNRWIIVVFNQWVKWMIYGMVERYEKYF